ncbi:hypothetical protein [Intrasporangium sp.]|uniref:hypothetical protein n=1 Tax=Intrasporangium sp. TaxID=1925024 RepID=UPI00293A730C|nr:hypothetical protein [Intrasporangium sp.]MDV3220393.1 hypothetical protein [Intrasporangium sp.]
MSQTDNEDRFVSPTVGKKFWVKHAYDVLVETAGRYDAVITYSDLAEEVQRRSGLHTTAQLRNWVGDLLKMIAQANHLRGEPPLTSLVVHKQDGHVGAGYDEVLRLAGRAPIPDEDERENHAAAARLECYRRWSDDVPADAQPTLVTRARPTRTSTATRTSSGRAPAPGHPPSRSREERRGSICPTCFMEMPVAGPCPNCA